MAEERTTAERTATLVGWFESAATSRAILLNIIIFITIIVATIFTIDISIFTSRNECGMLEWGRRRRDNRRDGKEDQTEEGSAEGADRH